MKSRISLIMGLIGLKPLEVFALELEKMLYLTVYFLAFTNINQSAPNLIKMYMTIRSEMTSIMGLIGPERR